MKSSITERVLRGMNSAGLFGLSRYAHRKMLLVLTYHSVVDVETDVLEHVPFLYRNAVTASQFREQLAFLQTRYTLVDSSEFLGILTGRIRNPGNVALLTFDDGLRNNATIVAPILSETDTPAVFFLPTAFVDEAHVPKLHWTELLAARLLEEPESILSRLSTGIHEVSHVINSPDSIIRGCITFLRTLAEDERVDRLHSIDLSAVDASRYPADRRGSSLFETMSWDEANELPSCIELGSHSHSHASLAALVADDVRTELALSKHRIEEVTGRLCSLLAYPYGAHIDVSPALYPLVEEAGYSAAFTQFSGMNAVAENQFAIKRINVPGLPSIAEFQYHTSGLHARRKGLSSKS